MVVSEILLIHTFLYLGLEQVVDNFIDRYVHVDIFRCQGQQVKLSPMRQSYSMSYMYTYMW